jgi:hypothetical protein
LRCSERGSAGTIIARQGKGRANYPLPQRSEGGERGCAMVAVGMPFETVGSRAAAHECQANVVRPKVVKQVQHGRTLVPQAMRPGLR